MVSSKKSDFSFLPEKSLKDIPHLYNCLSDNGYIRKNADKKEIAKERDRHSSSLSVYAQTKREHKEK